VAKRKPPSQRAERQLDETARAIAKLKEDEADKIAEAKKLEATENRRGKITGNTQRPGLMPGPAVATSSKRPKQPGS
jgi:hypothetical protein